MKFNNDIHKPKSLAERAYDELVRRITKLYFSPGLVLVEQHLVDELNIGRTPLREALQRLSIEGLVTRLPHRGMFVSEITYSNVKEIYEFRSLIDGHACHLAAMRANQTQIEELYQHHNNLVQAAQDDDVDLYIEHDRQFHNILAKASNNSFLSETVPRIFNLHLRLWFYISLRIVDSWHVIAEPHMEMTKAVCNAISERDSERAEQAMKNYIFDRRQELKVHM